MNLSYGHKFVPCPLQVCRRQTCIKTLEKTLAAENQSGIPNGCPLAGREREGGVKACLMRMTRMPLCELLASFHANDSHRCMRESRSARYEMFVSSDTKPLILNAASVLRCL